jgi:hypothetical protein
MLQFINTIVKWVCIICMTQFTKYSAKCKKWYIEQEGKAQNTGKYKFANAQNIIESYKLVTMTASAETNRCLEEWKGERIIFHCMCFYTFWILYHICILPSKNKFFN